jgi:hypothetical protein
MGTSGGLLWAAQWTFWIHNTLGTAWGEQSWEFEGFCPIPNWQSKVLYQHLRVIRVDKPDTQLTKDLHKFLNYAINLKLGNLSSIYGRGKRFFFSPKRPDWLWPHPSSYLMSTGVSFPVRKWQMCEMISYLRLLPRLRMSVAVPPLSYSHSWCTKGQSYVWTEGGEKI